MCLLTYSFSLPHWQGIMGISSLLCGHLPALTNVREDYTGQRVLDSSRAIECVEDISLKRARFFVVVKLEIWDFKSYPLQSSILTSVF